MRPGFHFQRAFLTLIYMIAFGRMTTDLLKLLEIEPREIRIKTSSDSVAL